MIDRNSILILCKNIKVDKGYTNVLNYTESQMLALCRDSSHKLIEIPNLSIIRKTGTIDVDIPYTLAIKANYMAFQNPDYENKWFFAWVDEIKYTSDSSVNISYTIDSFSTFHNQLVYNKCFVTREHVNNDTIGAHTVPENIETGEYIVNSQDYYNGLDNLKYVIQCTEWSTSAENKPLATNFGGIFMAGGAYVCDNINQVVNILQAYSARSKSDAVYSLYMVPASMITNIDANLQYNGQNTPISETKSVNKVNNVDGYTPKNKKLLTFPYNYMLISNNNGSSNILHYERFVGNTCNFTIKGVPTLGGSIKLIPNNYDNNLNNEEEGIMAGKLPTLNWSEDSYTNWLTQNSVNIALGVASSGLTILGGVGMMATGGGALAGAGAVVNGAMSIANQVGAVYQHSLQPNSAKGNVNGGDINVCDKKNGFYFYKITIKEEYARIIDDYFSRFGYKVNLTKIPNITGRRNWNYVEIGPTEIIGYGEIPANYLEKINEAFRKGITIWHSHSAIGNYDLNNSII